MLFKLKDKYYLVNPDILENEIEILLNYKLGLVKSYEPKKDIQIVSNDYVLFMDFSQKFCNRKMLEYEYENDELKQTAKVYEKTIDDLIKKMIKNAMHAWSSLTDDKSKENFLRALSQMKPLIRIIFVTKRKMQVIIRNSNGINDNSYLRKGVLCDNGMRMDINQLAEEWNCANRTNDISTKEYINLFGYAQKYDTYDDEIKIGKKTYWKIYLCVDTIKNCTNILKNDSCYNVNVKKFEDKHLFSPECHNISAAPLPYFDNHLLEIVFMHELGHVFGLQIKDTELEAQLWASIFLRSHLASCYMDFLSYFQTDEYQFKDQQPLFINETNEEDIIARLS